MPSGRLIRDIAMWLLGAGVLIHEVVIAATERPTILAAALALLGGPAILRRDEKAVRVAPVDTAAPAVIPPAPVDPAAGGEKGGTS